MSLARAGLALLLLGAVIGCSGGSAAPHPRADASTPDSGSHDSASADASSSDAQAPDAASLDAPSRDSDAGTGSRGHPRGDSGSGDAAIDSASLPTQTAWGRIEGPCKTLLDAVSDPTPAFVQNTYVFDKTSKFDPSPLSPGAKKRYEGPNAGGSSKCSEVMSMEVFIDCAGAKVYKTETEVKYDKPGSITDYVLTSAGGDKVGVSVTRAYKGPTIDTYTEKDATALLKKKLAGINESTLHVNAADKWKKQYLHLWTLHEEWGATVRTAWGKLPAALKADTIVLVTVEQGTDLVVSDKCDD